MRLPKVQLLLGCFLLEALADISVFCRSNALSAAIDLAFLAAFSICFARRPVGTPVKAISIAGKPIMSKDVDCKVLTPPVI